MLGEKSVVLADGAKRKRKKVQKLELNVPKEKKKLDVQEGQGEKLGDLPRVEFMLGRTKSDDLKPLHKILFNRPGSVS